jgi:predicted RNase H-like HicB family nuclease
MPDIPTIKDYDIHVFWDNRAEYFVAEIPEIYTCAADGATQADAVSNLQETFAVLKEAYAEEKIAFPKPMPELPISVQELSALSEVVKISRLAELSGIPGQTLATKLKRGTEFNIGESRKIARALGEKGLALRPGNFARQQRLPRPVAAGIKRPGLDNRHRDLSGQIDKKRGNTTVKSLRKQYGQHLASGRRSDLMLKTLRDERGGKSLSQLLKG